MHVGLYIGCHPDQAFPEPSNPFVNPVTSQGCFGVGLCWDLGMIRLSAHGLHV